MAIHLLQSMISSDNELEVEHWLIKPLNKNRSSRKDEAIALLMQIVNERILKTKTMGQILTDLSNEEESKDEQEMHDQLKSQCLLICNIFSLLNKMREEGN